MANTSKRGFASMDATKQREIASKGGRAAHAKGTAHEFTSDEARVAGRKGGEAVSRDRTHMATIGREGGHSRGARARSGMTASDDVAQSNEQSFEREVTSERSGFEPAARAMDRARDERDRGSVDRGADRSGDRGSDSSRSDRSQYGTRENA
jgi:general stress protein YciG